MAKCFGSDTNLKQKPTSCDQLRVLIRQERIPISQDVTQTLISSTPDRTAAVTEVQQGSTL